MKKNIVLIGFMGTGKTQIGKRVAKAMNRPFIDIDREIERTQRKRISDIFAEEGEEYFRYLESKIIEEVSEINNQVIATGGGAVLNEKNLEILRKNGVLICLKASPEIIYNRIKTDDQRPLLSGEDLYKKICELLAKREAKYMGADHLIDTSDLSIDEAAQEIVDIASNK